MPGTRHLTSVIPFAQARDRSASSSTGQWPRHLTGHLARSPVWSCLQSTEPHHSTPPSWSSRAARGISQRALGDQRSAGRMWRTDGLPTRSLIGVPTRPATVWGPIARGPVAWRLMA